jgi:predicted MFS family arabinose efflux permease
MILGMSLLLGARGIGALAGPLVSARLAGNSDTRLRLGILFGYLLVAAGYVAIGGAPSVWLACLCVIVAHGGGSTVWVFSTTLLQLHTEDRFRGRVFAADLALSMLTIAVGAYSCGRFLDWGFSPRTVATATGVIMLIPAALWAWSMRKWQNQPVEVENST